MKQKSHLFVYLILLSILFIFLEVSFFLQWINYYLGDYKVVAHHISIPKSALSPIFYFIFVQASIHFTFIILIWAMTRLNGIALGLSQNQTEKLGFVFWVLGIILILLANQYFFPNSKFSYIVSLIIPSKIGFILFIMLAFVASLIGCIALIGLFYLSRLFLLALSMLGMMVAVHAYAHSHVNQLQSTQPNIIFIGIDSLRPDFLGHFGARKQTPHLDDFLTQASVFNEAVTPLARTYPAWVSILTGLYPKHNGIRTNLQESTGLTSTHTLPSILQKKGYETLFATDESRFSNIDQRFGFNNVITPPIGFNDFLLGTLNDFPISNLLINTHLGRFLFPNSYANRGVFTAYDPDVFLELLKSHLSQIQKRPLFLAVHFCLPHFPYFWGREKANDQSLINYQEALRRVDKQFQDFITLLNSNHLLEHSIVILLSDHGEAIELHGDRITKAELFIPGRSKKLPHFYPESVSNESIDQSAGHGTDVLGLAQYKILLAIRFYGAATAAKKISFNKHARASLLDIKPTVLSLLGLKDNEMDGIAFASPLQIDRDLFIESDFSPKAIRSVHPEIKKILFEGIEYFKINPKTTRVTVKEDMMHLIMSSKQYADLYHNWILALYPQPQKRMIPILVNLETGKWTNDLQSNFAIKSPANHMLLALKRFYGEDLGTV